MITASLQRWLYTACFHLICTWSLSYDQNHGSQDTPAALWRPHAAGPAVSGLGHARQQPAPLSCSSASGPRPVPGPDRV